MTGSRASPGRLLAVVPGGLYAGAEIVLLRDLDELRARGWSVRVACVDGPLVAVIGAAGFDRIPIPDLRLPEGAKPVALGRLATRAINAAVHVRRALHSGEVLLANGINVLPMLRIARLIGAKNPTVWFAHDVLVRGDRLRVLRMCARAVDEAIAVSDATAAPLRTVGIHTTVVWNGTAWPVEPAPDSSFDPPVIGLAAVLTEHKGQLILLDALARMQRTDAVVELMGGVLPKDGGYERRVRARAQEPDLAGRVRFLGHHADPLQRVRTWAVSVRASTDPEAGPLTALEAMSVGVPFVTTRHGGVMEVLGDAGLSVEPGNVAALADALDQILGDPELRARCRAAGPKIIAERRLTIEAHRTNFVSEIERIAGTVRR